MKRFTIIALVLVLTLGMLAGCRSRREDTADTTGTTTATEGLLPDNGGILPDTQDMVPNDTVDPSSGANDGMVDPTNGANQDTTGTTGATDSTGDTGANRSRRHPMR